MSENNVLVTLENATKLSSSLLYRLVYANTPAKNVQLTNNAVTAYSYAQFVLRYLQDGLSAGFIDPNEPIYLVTYGAAIEKFGYLFLRVFSQFLRQFGLEHLKCCLVITATNHNDLLATQQNPYFAEFLQKGRLDCAIYDNAQNTLALVNKKLTLNAGSCSNPLIVIANYFYNQTTNDLFKTTDGKLAEGLVSIETQHDNVNANLVNAPDKLVLDFTFNEVNLPYYNDVALDSILTTYQQTLSNSTFTVPSGAINCFANLSKFSNNRALLIIADDGFSTIDSFKDSNPQLAFHQNAFSVDVNFDFLSQYVKGLGGDSLLAEDYAGFKVCLFALGAQFADLTFTRWAYNQFNVAFSTKEFSNVKNSYVKRVEDMDLDDLLSLLKLSYWDADVFYAVSSRICALITQATPGYLKTLRTGLQIVETNFFFSTTSKNTLFELGRVYHLLGDLDIAIKHYNDSLKFYGEESPLSFNLGLCYYYQHDLQHALQHFQRAVELNPENSAAKEWIEFVNKELAK